MTAILTTISLILIFGLLVFVHELGHFVAAKLVGVKVEEFSLGFGPKLVGIKRGETEYMIKYLPLGGYVKLEGEERDANRGFHNRALWQKAVVLLAGVTMNVLLAVFLLALYLPGVDYSVQIVNLVEYDFVGAESVNRYYPIYVGEIQAGSAAAANGINTGDLIVSVEGQKFSSEGEFKEVLAVNAGEIVQVDLFKAGDTRITSIEAELDSEGKLGVAYAPPRYGLYVVNYPNNITAAISHTLNLFGYQVPAISSLVNRSIVESDPSHAGNSVSGFVGVSAAVNQFVEASDFIGLVNLAAVISISLALVNLLPLPILDGGQLLLVIIESGRGKRFSEESIGKVSIISFVVIMALSLLITIKDVVQFDVISSVLNSFRNGVGI